MTSVQKCGQMHSLSWCLMGKAAVPSKAVVTKEGLPWYLQVHSWLGCAEVIQLPGEPVLEIPLKLLQQLKKPWNSFLYSDGWLCEGCYPRARLEESLGPKDRADHDVLCVLERGWREDRTWEGSRGHEKCILLAIMRGESQLVLSGQGTEWNSWN